MQVRGATVPHEDNHALYYNAHNSGADRHARRGLLHGGTGSSFITAAINWRFNCRLSESQNGFRAIRTSVLRELDLREDHTTIEQEMIIKTLRRGFRMAEVPSHEHPRAHGSSHINVWRSAPRYGWSLVKYLFL